MRFNKKKAMALSLALCMLAILSFSTLAWFNDSNSVTNKFYVISSEDAPEDADDLFSIDVWEHDDKNGDGVVDSIEKMDNGQEFNNILPGVSIDKVPYVENTGSYYSQWVRLTITFPNKAVWNVLKGEKEEPLQLLTVGSDWGKWQVGEKTINDAGYVYTYYLAEPLAPGEKVGSFTAVTFDSSLTQHELARIQNEGAQLPIEIEVKAEAVQLELGNTAKEAFAAIEG